MDTNEILNAMSHKAMQNGGNGEHFYFSDILHDDRQMRRMLKETGSTQFYWAVTDCGTHFFQTLKDARNLITAINARSLFIVDITGYSSNSVDITIHGLRFLKLDLPAFIKEC